MLEIVARRLGLVLAEPGEAGAVQGGVALAHGFGEGIGARQELRSLALHRAQALLGFQLAVVLTKQFSELDQNHKLVHLTAAGLIALSAVCLIAPSAYHRLVYAGEDSEAFHKLGGRFIVAGSIALALGLACDTFVIVAKITRTDAAGIVASLLTLSILITLWHVVPAFLRAKLRSG